MSVGEFVVVQAIACSLFCAFVAGQKNRDSVVWFFVGLFFGLFALIAIAGSPPIRRDVESSVQHDQHRPSDMYWLGTVVGRWLGRRR